jgi:hypothetical protein
MAAFLDRIRFRLSKRKIKIIEFIVFAVIILLFITLIKVIWNI